MGSRTHRQGLWAIFQGDLETKRELEEQFRASHPLCALLSLVVQGKEEGSGLLQPPETQPLLRVALSLLLIGQHPENSLCVTAAYQRNAVFSSFLHSAFPS